MQQSFSIQFEERKRENSFFSNFYVDSGNQRMVSEISTFKLTKLSKKNLEEKVVFSLKVLMNYLNCCSLPEKDLKSMKHVLVST
jgi:hypothetical protein